MHEIVFAPNEEVALLVGGDGEIDAERKAADLAIIQREHHRRLKGRGKGVNESSKDGGWDTHAPKALLRITSDKILFL